VQKKKTSSFCCNQCGTEAIYATVGFTDTGGPYF